MVVFDDDTKQRVESDNFLVYHIKWYPLGIDKKAAIYFGRGSHAVIMIVEHMMRNELVQIGYNVLFHDSDVVWRKNPVSYLGIFFCFVFTFQRSYLFHLI